MFSAQPLLEFHSQALMFEFDKSLKAIRCCYGIQ